jgi:pimeloyl-ACP methyl ester carboxylesterase
MRAGLLVALLLAGGGCAAPLRVQHVDPQAHYRELSDNVLSSGDLSEFTRIVLRRHDVLDQYEHETHATLAKLLTVATKDRGRSDEVFALAELAFFEAERRHSNAHYLGAAVYAYAFLFPEDARERPGAFDPRTRFACDLYNRALAEAFTDHGSRRSFRARRTERGYVLPRQGRFRLPFGKIEVAFDAKSLEWHDYRLVDFTPVGEMRIEGIRNRYRQPGIGAALAARPVPVKGYYGDDDLVGPNIRVPVTIVLEVDQPRRQLGAALVRATLEAHATTDETFVNLSDETIPLEAEPTAVLAATLVAARPWNTELAAFLGNALKLKPAPVLLRATSPYRAGKIPVVFVHGTASSIFRWADMANDLMDDPFIRDRYQFWFFTYDSGNPIAYSAYRLRTLLSQQVNALDPDGVDPALREMIVIGHSQGGLLAKMTAVDAGDRLWANVSRKPFEEVSLSDQTRQLLKDALFVKPLPFVKRLIFIATPHRGSFLAGPQIVRRLVQRLVRLPGDLLAVGTDLSGLTSRGDLYMSVERIPTSIDNMSPGHPFIRALSGIPLDPSVKAHSIIPVKQEQDIESGDDGVVKYQSAHIEGVESELIVHDVHSTQANPHTIEEVSRILHLHGASSAEPSPLPSRD